MAEDLFSRVTEANSVLSDPDRRAEHDVYLDRKAKGLPTDVGAILRAEGVFQRGEALFKAARWEDAEVQFREAISLNHTEAEFHAFLGMTIFLVFPFTRLVHVWSAPIWYLGRRGYQVVRSSGRPAGGRVPRRNVQPAE